jgi:hypothetical protein
MKRDYGAAAVAEGSGGTISTSPDDSTGSLSCIPRQKQMR